MAGREMTRDIPEAGSGRQGRPAHRGMGLRLVVAGLVCLGGVVWASTIPRATSTAPILTLDVPVNGPNDAEPLSGSGFPPGDRVDIMIANSVFPGGTVLATLNVSAAGRFSGTVTLPLGLDAGPDHPNTLTAVAGSDRSLRASAHLIGVAVQAVLTTVQPDTLTPGGRVEAIYGTGFGTGGPSERHRPDVITLFLGDVPLATATTGPSGNFALGGIVVPAAVPAGHVALTARGAVTGIGQSDLASKPIMVGGSTTIAVTPAQGRPGATVEVRGAGFAPAEQVTLRGTYPDPAAPLGSVGNTVMATAIACGEIGPISVTIPATAPVTAQFALIARGTVSRRAAGELVSLAGNLSLFIDPQAGPPGTVVTLNGFGFAAGQPVSVSGAGSTATAVADVEGVVTASLPISATAAPGSYTLQARDAGGGTAAAQFLVSAAPRATIAISPSIAVPRSSIVLTGTGYTAGVPVSLTLGGAAPARLPIVNAQGAFTGTVTAPQTGAPAAFPITARDTPSGRAARTVLHVVPPLRGRWQAAESTTLPRPAIALTGTLHLLGPVGQPAPVALASVSPTGTAHLVPIAPPARLVAPGLTATTSLDGPPRLLVESASLLQTSTSPRPLPLGSDPGSVGQARLLRGNYQGAITAFTQALGRGPGDATAYGQRALARLYLGNLYGALADYTQALRLTPRDSRLYAGRGLARSLLGNLAGALSDDSQALSLAPDAITFLNRGSIRVGLGNLYGALADYTQALRLMPASALAAANRGTVRLYLGNLYGALADFTQALQLQPGNADAAYNRGVVLAALGRGPAARAAFSQTLALAPESGAAYAGRGRLRFLQGDAAGALADFTQALRLRPRDAATWHNRGVARTVLGNGGGALADETRALSLAPSAPIYTSRGLLRLFLGNAHGALGDFTQALRLGPAAADTYLGRGLAEAILGTSTAALADFTQALGLAPRNGGAYAGRGLVRAALGNAYGALADLTRALQLAPDGTTSLARARLRLRLGNGYGALADAVEALRRMPTSAAAYAMRGDARVAQGDYRDALADYTQSLQFNPTNAAARYNRGYVLYALGQPATAVADFTLARRLYGAAGAQAAYRRTLDALRLLGQ